MQRSLCKARLPQSCLKAVADADIANLKYFRVTRGKIAGVPVDISRTGYTGDLGYEIWMPWNDAVKVWDALADKGKQFDLHAAGMLALDVARVEAGLLLIEVDYTSSQEGADSVAEVLALRTGLRQDGAPRKGKLHRQTRSRADAKNGVPRQLVGLEVDWTDIEQLYDRYGLTPAAPSQASRVAVPCVLRRETGWQSDDYELVANPEKAHRLSQR